ncbi:hypothetical protein [Actinocorallia aurantiaca]|uniref:Uncharacterized protein n=1 Tax=Actinocorallia aurantiaca TaxID=46204 RepID=A0ABN3U935_9ACTN
MIPTKTTRRWPLYLAAAAFLLYAIKAPESAAASVQAVAASLSTFIGAF